MIPTRRGPIFLEESCKECTEYSVGVEDPGLGIHTIQVLYPEEGVHARVDR